MAWTVEECVHGMDSGGMRAWRAQHNEDSGGMRAWHGQWRNACMECRMFVHRAKNSKVTSILPEIRGWLAQRVSEFDQ